MKTILTSLALSLTLAANATIFTVSTNPAVAAQYSNIQSAHDVAEPGDTLQLVGSDVAYNYLNATKLIHVIGPGWGGPGLRAYLYAPTFGAGSNGSTVEGVNFSYNVNIQAPNITIEDSFVYQVNYYAAGTNSLIRNCVGFRYIYDLGVAQGTVISNCLFQYSDGNDAGQPYVYFNGANSNMAYPSLITNCTMYKLIFEEMYNAQFANCVIHSIPETMVGNTADYDNCFGCTFNNSMLFCSGCALSDVDGGTTLVDNLNNDSNPFVSAPQTPNAYANGTTPFADLNFSLVADSPGINAGTDGTTIGIQGGAYPFADGSDYGGLSGVVPYVSSFIINNPVIPQGGTLNIQATGIIPANQ